MREQERKIRADERERCRIALVAIRWGPPSSWHSVNPPNWHLDRPCTPADAAMHDNGVVDAMRTIHALSDEESDATPSVGKSEGGT